MKVYKLKEKSEPGVIIVDVRSKLSEYEDKILTKLPGDLFLIFSESTIKTIDPEIFSGLYGATWYGVYKEDKTQGFWEALDYIESITNYTSMSVVSSFYCVKDETLNSIQKLQYSGIETSVFGSRELTASEKEKLYLINPKIIEIAFGVRFKRFGKKDNRGKYSRRTSTDKILFLRPSSVSKIREKMSPEILHSFTGLGIESLIPSLIPENTYINVKVDEAKV